MSVTALQIITDAFAVPNVLMQGETPGGPMAASALRSLNRFVGYLGLSNLAFPTQAPETFPLTAYKGGPPSPVAPVLGPYTIGPGGDFNRASRPPFQNAIVGCGLLLRGVSNPPVEVIARSVFTDDEYQSIAVKNLTSVQFTGMWYNPTFSSGLGSISLYPVPDNSNYSIVLYLRTALPLFANQNAAYDLPDGYEECFVYNLARRLAGMNGRSLLPEDIRIAVAALRRVKVSNVKLRDLLPDPMFAPSDRRHIYNIQSGT